MVDTNTRSLIVEDLAFPVGPYGSNDTVTGPVCVLVAIALVVIDATIN
ncbi:hypothetical protein [Asticcacaulis sp. AC466]|nr:hypothetical protein [Asticcacaulis sp. AC466]